jgi:hypothetical protein
VLLVEFTTCRRNVKKKIPNIDLRSLTLLFHKCLLLVFPLSPRSFEKLMILLLLLLPELSMLLETQLHFQVSFLPPF